MKILKIIGIVILVLIVVGAVVLVIFVKTFDIARYKPQILQQAQKALGRLVDFQDIHLDISFKDGLSLNLKNFTIEDDPRFQKGNCVAVDTIALGVDLFSIITKQKVLVSSVQIEAPDIVVIKDKNGVINLQQLGQQPTAPAATGTPTPTPTGVEYPSATSTSTQTTAMSLPPILIHTIKINNGHLRYVDQSFSPEVNADVNQLGIQVNDFSLDKPFSFMAAAAVLSDAKNVQVSGNAELNLRKNEVHLTNVKTNVNLTQISLGSVSKIVPLPPKTPFPQTLQGMLEVVVKDLVVNPQHPPSLIIDVQLTNGRVAFKDIAPGVSVDTSLINFNVNQFSLNNPFSFKGQAAVFSTEPDINLEGSAKFDMATNTVEVKNTNLDVDFAKVTTAALTSAISMLKTDQLPESMTGQLNVNLKSFETGGPKGIKNCVLIGDLKNGSVKLSQLLVPIQIGQLTFNVMGTKADFNTVVNIGEGNLTAQGNLNDLLSQQGFVADMKLANLDLSKTLNQVSQPVKIQGTLLGEYSLRAEGLDPDHFMKTLSGNGNFQIKDGRLTDMNILKMVLDKISVIPNLGQKVQANLPPAYQTKLQQKDTILNKVYINSLLQNAAIVIQPMEVDADGFLLNADGNVGFDLNTSLKADFIIPADLSEKIIAGTPELQLLTDENKRISFPGKISGKYPQISYLPDVEYIGKRIIQNKGKEQLEKVLDKVFGSKDSSSQGTTSSDGQNPQPKEKRPEQQLLEGILDKVFK